MTPTQLTLRALVPADWDAVAAIYQEGIATGHATFEQRVPEWRAWDAAHLATCRLIAEQSSRVVGWAALSPVSERCVYGGVAEVSVYVAAHARGQGVGRQLLSALIVAAEQAGLWTLQAGIFPENVASLVLHNRCGFREIGIRERIGVLNGVWRDTVLLEYRSTTVGVEPTPSTMPRDDQLIPVPEAKLVMTDEGLVPQGSGWYVINAREARWSTNAKFGTFCRFEGDHRFPQVGINLHVVAPGRPSCHYHGEDNQEDFLVLSGQCRLLIEGEERLLKPWDFVHCPRWAQHVFVGAEDAPCLILMVGGRSGPQVVYPLVPLAQKYDACPRHATSSPQESYAECPPNTFTKAPTAMLPPR